jgi:hypothetical protein
MAEVRRVEPAPAKPVPGDLEASAHRHRAVTAVAPNRTAGNDVQTASSRRYATSIRTRLSDIAACDGALRNGTRLAS